MENIKNLSISNQSIIEAYNRGYRVTKDGSILNSKKEIIKLVLKQKYYVFGIRINNKINNIFIHRLQAYQKFGNKIFEDKIIVRHLNGNPLDNSCDNIDIGYVKDNLFDIPIEQRIKNTQNSTNIGCYLKYFNKIHNF